jgi:hypothetical protein
MGGHQQPDCVGALLPNVRSQHVNVVSSGQALKIVNAVYVGVADGVAVAVPLV